MTLPVSEPTVVGSRRRPLTEAEEQLWLLERANPRDTAYLVPFAVWVDGALEVPVLTRALREVVVRHEILRTVVRDVDGAPVAEVLPDAGVPCPVTRVASDTAALAAASAIAGQVFAAGAPRVRAAVFQVNAGRWLLLLVLHHAVCDASSLWVLLRELAAIYSADLADRPADLPPAPQFTDLLPDGAEADRAVSELAAAVRSAPDVVNLPYDRDGDPAQSAAGGLLRLPIPASLNDAVEVTARRLAVSPNAVLLAAYGVLLDVIAGAKDVLVSVPVSRRAAPDRQQVVGFLVHSVPVRLRTGSCDTADQLITRAWAALRHGWTHSAASFGRVVAEVNPHRIPGMNPLCQCEFSVQTVPARLPALGPATLAYQFVHNGGCKFSLSLEVVLSGGARTLAIEYQAARWSPGTVRRLANLYLRVLSGLTAVGDLRVADLELLSAMERHWLDDHAITPPSGAPRAPVAERIERTIQTRPAAVAVADASGGALTYADLGALSANLADVLRAAGVTTGHRVAVLGDRETAAIVAIVAVIRAGASFVALADDTPADRVERVLDAARPTALIVTTARLLDVTPARWRTRATRHASGWLLTPGGDQEPERSPGEAYLVFTSGSTGEARGVSVPSTAISAITAAWDAVFGLTGQPGRHLQLAPFSFDVFVGDLARTLCFGGTLVLASRDDVIDPRRLAGLLRREEIDTAEFVPVVSRLLTEYLEQDGASLPAMRRVMVGSDVWPAADARRLRALLPGDARLYCTYGTSETAVDATLFDVGAREKADRAATPIGRPFPGVRVSVRDRVGRAVPPLWPGELWIGGDTVASGYLTLDDPAGGRFRAEPDSDGRPRRWYRTGDRVQWDQEGQLHLLGRIDGETKIRGVRVNPAEIEAVLAEHPSVTAAAVAAVGEGAGRALAAFVTGPSEEELACVAAHARGLLPPVAVPASFRVLDRIPVTRHGKVDYAALAEQAGAAGPDGERAEPSGELERTVASVSAEVFDLPRIGALDDFYALGASSIGIARFAWRVSLATGHEVSVRDVIAAPSVRALAGLISGTPAPVSAGAAAPGGVAAPVPTAPARAGVPARQVVLTGVTGNLGPGILRALLAAEVSTVTCLVRASDPAHARARVRAALTVYGADPGLADDPRLRYCPADLAVPGGGLTTAAAELVTSSDVVVNSAAWVNFLYPYQLLAPVNVAGVATLARLAGQGRIKPLHHLSTRSAIAARGKWPTGGYNQTKAAAEELLRSCRELGLPVSVYRPGFVLGRLAIRPSGAGLLESFLRECVRLGACPALPGSLNVVTADHVAERLVGNVLSLAPRDLVDLAGVAPLPWPTAWETLRAHGVRLTEVSAAEWLAMAGAGRLGEGWLEPFLPLCAEVGLPELLSEDGPDAPEELGGQLVAEAWRHVCAGLAELEGQE